MHKTKTDNKKINLALLKALMPGESLIISDTDIRGFYIRVGKRSISFYVRKKQLGRDHVICLGRWPDIKPDEARRDAQKIIGAIVNFQEPEAGAANRYPTIAEAIDWYVKKAKNKDNAISVMRYWHHLRSRRIAEVTQSDVRCVHERLSDKPYTANNAVKYLSGAISGLLKQLGLQTPNPALGIDKYPSIPRKRFLTEEEAPRLMDALRQLQKSGIHAVQADALLMMIFTGQRKGNVLAMNLSEIERDVWVIPREKSKNGKEIIVPLNEYAIEIVQKRRDFALEGSLFVRRGLVLQDIRKTFLAACRASGVENCHPHDLRRTLGSWMLMNGTPIEVVSRTLGHSSIRVTEQVYAHLLPKKISTATGSAIAAMMRGKV